MITTDIEQALNAIRDVYNSSGAFIDSKNYNIYRLAEHARDQNYYYGKSEDVNVVIVEFLQNLLQCMERN